MTPACSPVIEIWSAALGAPLKAVYSPPEGALPAGLQNLLDALVDREVIAFCHAELS